MSLTMSASSQTSAVPWLPALVPLWDAAVSPTVLRGSGLFVCGSAESSDVTITMSGVAAEHCILQFEHGRLSVRRAAGRVWINDFPIISTERVNAGDLLAIGPAVFRVEAVRQQGPFAERAASLHPAAVSEFAGPEADAAVQEPSRAAFVAAHARLEAHVLRLEAQLNDELRQPHVLSDRPEDGDGQPPIRSHRQRIRRAAREGQEEIDGLEADLYARDAEELIRMRTLLAAREELLQQQESDLALQRHDLQMRLSSLEQARSQLDDRGAILQANEERLAQRERRADKLQNHADHQMAELERGWAEVRHSTEQIEALKRKVESESESLTHAQVQLGRRERELLDLEAQIAEREETLRVHMRESGAEVSEHSRLQSDVFERDLQSRQDEFALQQQQFLQALDAARTDLADLQQDLESRAVALSELEQNVAGREAALAAREAALAGVSSMPQAESPSVRELTEIAEQRAELRQAQDDAEQAACEAIRRQEEIRQAEQRLAEWQRELDARWQETADRVAGFQRLRRQSAALVPREPWSSLSPSDAAPADDRRPPGHDSIARAVEDLQSAFDAARMDAVCAANQPSDVGDLLSHISQCETELQDCQNDLEHWRTTAQSSQVRLRELEHTVASLQQDRDRLQSAFDDAGAAAARAVEAAEAHAAAAADLARAESRATDLQTQLDAREAERSTLQAELDEARREAKHLEEKLCHHAATEADLATALGRAAELIGLVELLQAEITELRDQQVLDRAMAARAADAAAELEVTQQSLHAAQTQVTELQRRLHEQDRDVVELRAACAAARAEASAALESTESEDAQAATLLQQIEALRGELESAAAGQHSRDADYEDRILRREAEMQLLRSELESFRRSSMERDEEQTDREVREQELHNALRQLQAAEAELQSELEDRDRVIQDLERRLQQAMDSAHSASAAAETTDGAVDAESMRILSLELDQRAALLDRREEELRERLRRVEDSESGLETERRGMLDARQQLEIARAELQISIQKNRQQQFQLAEDDTASAAPTHNPPAPEGFAESQFTNENSVESSCEQNDSPLDLNVERDDDDAHQLRSELASLFGVRKRHAGEEDREVDDTDLSQPVGDNGQVGVCLRFSQAADLLIDENSTADSEATDSESSGAESEDFVARYMEDLLARSRSNAGAALPNELKKGSQGRQGGSAPARPQQRSFIDDYMSGRFDDSLTGSADAPSSATSDGNDSGSTTAARAPRPKADLHRMRADMNSFRSVSAQSVENALAKHAMRKERLGINARIVFAVILAFTAIGLFLANVVGFSSQPQLIWVTAAAAVISVGEVLRKVMTVRTRYKGVMDRKGRPVETTPAVADTEDGVLPATTDDEFPTTLPAHPGSPAERLAADRNPVRHSSDSAERHKEPPADPGATHLRASVGDPTVPTTRRDGDSAIEDDDSAECRLDV